MAPRKKKPEDELKAAKLEAKALELHLLENLSFAQIAQRLKLPNRMAAKRLLDRAENNLLQEQTARNYDVWRAKRVRTLELVIGEAWAGWKRSVGKKSRHTQIKEPVGVVLTDKTKKKPAKPKKPKNLHEQMYGWDEDEEIDYEHQALSDLQNDPLAMVVAKDTSVKWSDAGDPRFLLIIKEAQLELAELLGVAKNKGGGGGFEEHTEGKPAELLIRQNVYIPGLGHLTPELFAQMLLDIEAKDDSPTD